MTRHGTDQRALLNWQSSFSGALDGLLADAVVAVQAVFPDRCDELLPSDLTFEEEVSCREQLLEQVVESVYRVFRLRRALSKE